MTKGALEVIQHYTFGVLDQSPLFGSVAVVARPQGF